MNPDRTIPWDWHPGEIPENVLVDESAYVETSFSFLFYRSQLSQGMQIGAGTSIYGGTFFDVGPAGRLTLGKCVLMNGPRITCDSEITIGDYSLISWRVVLMDNYRLSQNTQRRRMELERVATLPTRHLSGDSKPRSIRIERNVWIGFDACILPGVTIGEGSVVGARSVVTQDIPPYTVVVGNPARVIRHLEVDEIRMREVQAGVNF